MPPLNIIKTKLCVEIRAPFPVKAGQRRHYKLLFFYQFILVGFFHISFAFLLFQPQNLVIITIIIVIIIIIIIIIIICLFACLRVCFLV